MNIAILGFGVVGGGTAEVLTKNKDIIKSKTGADINIAKILDLREFPDSPFGSLVTHDFNDILNDPTIDTVVETMGGAHPAYDFSKAALEAGKNVVTSNKLVVAEFGVELLELAKKNGVRYLFEASVGGGIPIIKPLISDLAQNNIDRIAGILNGTTNYILTQMIENGTSFEAALKEAQAKGYAEADPTSDVEGHDAARKIVILAALVSGKLISPEDISVEGITASTSADVALADQLGYSVKLIGYAEMNGDKTLAFVAPRLVPRGNPLCDISDVFNGILVRCDMLGDAMFYGRGAGKLPTASAVVSDIIDIAAKAGSSPASITWKAATESDLLPLSDYKTQQFIRVSEKTDLIPGTLVESDQGVAYLTEEMTEADAIKLCEKIEQSGTKVLNRIRVI